MGEIFDLNDTAECIFQQLIGFNNPAIWLYLQQHQCTANGMELVGKIKCHLLNAGNVGLYRNEIDQFAVFKYRINRQGRPVGGTVFAVIQNLIVKRFTVFDTLSNDIYGSWVGLCAL